MTKKKSRFEPNRGKNKLSLININMQKKRLETFFNCVFVLYKTQVSHLEMTKKKKNYRIFYTLMLFNLIISVPSSSTKETEIRQKDRPPLLPFSF